MPSRFVEVTGTLDELDIRSTLQRWPRLPEVNVSEILERIPNVTLPEPMKQALDRAPPKMVGGLYLVALLLLVMQVCMVGCRRRSILRAYAHAKRL